MTDVFCWRKGNPFWVYMCNISLIGLLFLCLFYCCIIDTAISWYFQLTTACMNCDTDSAMLGEDESTVVCKVYTACASDLQTDSWGKNEGKKGHMDSFPLGCFHNCFLCYNALTWIDSLHRCYKTKCQHDCVGSLWAPDWVQWRIPDAKNKEHYLAQYEAPYPDEPIRISCRILMHLRVKKILFFEGKRKPTPFKMERCHLSYHWYKKKYLCKPFPDHHVTVWTSNEEETPADKMRSLIGAFGAWYDAKLPTNKDTHTSSFNGQQRSGNKDFLCISSILFVTWMATSFIREHVALHTFKQTKERFW